MKMILTINLFTPFIVVEVGDDITPCLDQRTLVLVNHQSTADVPLLMTTFNTKNEVLPNIMWIMDKVFMYTNFGIVSVIHKDFFIGSVSSFAPKFFDLGSNAEMFIFRDRVNVSKPSSSFAGILRKLTFQESASGWCCSPRADS